MALWWWVKRWWKLSPTLSWRVVIMCCLSWELLCSLTAPSGPFKPAWLIFSGKGFVPMQVQASMAACWLVAVAYRFKPLWLANHVGSCCSLAKPWWLPAVLVVSSSLWLCNPSTSHCLLPLHLRWATMMSSQKALDGVSKILVRGDTERVKSLAMRQKVLEAEHLASTH